MRESSPITRGDDSILLSPERAREAKVKHPGASELWGRPAKIVMDDWSKAKAREDCTPFTFELATSDTSAPGMARRYPRSVDVKGQEQFVKKLNTLMAKQTREAAKRAKIATKLAA